MTRNRRTKLAARARAAATGATYTQAKRAIETERAAVAPESATTPTPALPDQAQ